MRRTGVARGALSGPQLACAPATLWLLAFMVLPLARLALVSLHGFDHADAAGSGWTLANYAKAIGDAFYRRVLLETFGWSAIVTFACLVLGFPLAVLMSTASGAARRALSVALLAPLLVSVVIRNYGWLILLGQNGPLARLLALAGLTMPELAFSPSAVMIALVHVSLAYMVLALAGSLERIDPAVLRAAESLGAGRWRILFRVLLPLSLPGVLAGSVIVFSLAASSFVTPEIMSGSRVKFAGSLVFEQIASLFNYPFGAALAFTLLIAELLLLAAYGGLLRLGPMRAAFR